MVSPFKTSAATDSLFTFDEGPENAIEQPENVQPFNTIFGTPPPEQDIKGEISFTDDLVMATLDDMLVEAGVSGFEIRFETSASCDSDVRSY